MKNAKKCVISSLIFREYRFKVYKITHFPASIQTEMESDPFRDCRKISRFLSFCLSLKLAWVRIPGLSLIFSRQFLKNCVSERHSASFCVILRNFRQKCSRVHPFSYLVLLNTKIEFYFRK